MPIIRSPSNCRCSLWFPYECGGGSVLSRGPFVRLFVRLLNCRCSLWFPYECGGGSVLSRGPFVRLFVRVLNSRCSLWFPYECGGGSVLSRGQFVSLTNRLRLRTLSPPHSYGNQRLQQQFDGLLMMGIVMPETCWAVAVRQSNKFYDWLLHLVGCFIWVIEDVRNHETLKPLNSEVNYYGQHFQ